MKHNAIRLTIPKTLQNMNRKKLTNNGSKKDELNGGNDRQERMEDHLHDEQVGLGADEVFGEAGEATVHDPLGASEQQQEQAAGGRDHSVDEAVGQAVLQPHL